ncbi:MAG: DUF507 family protein [Rhodobacterales bacterium]|nr:DUF507 family protein [Rhodobacterales bacterium]
MKLYRAKIPVIAKELILRLCDEGDIDVELDNRDEAEADLVAIMEDFSRRDSALRTRIKDYMADRQLPYGEYGRTRKRLCEEAQHPMGGDVDRFLARQFIENLMISRFIEEVFEEDRVMYKKAIEVLKGHDVDERSIREEAAAKVKNEREGTVEYEIALQAAVRDVKKRQGLI